MEKRRCKNCGCLFEPSPKHPNQKYCTRKKCQRARKNKWQREKLAQDKDYRDNQADCQARWRAKNPDYWKRYRIRNPEYTKRNREKQRERNRSRRVTNSILNPIANMDVVKSKNHGFTGRYKLIPMDGQMIANMDALIVEINAITGTYG